MRQISLVIANKQTDTHTHRDKLFLINIDIIYTNLMGQNTKIKSKYHYNLMTHKPSQDEYMYIYLNSKMFKVENNFIQFVKTYPLVMVQWN